jgi:hypothetical protein
MVPNDDNVIPLRANGHAASGDLPLSLEELSEAVGAIGRCLDEIAPEPVAGGGFGRQATSRLYLQITAVERWLRKLDDIEVVTWPDTRWALRFCNARMQAVSCIQALKSSRHPASGSREDPQRVFQEAGMFVDFDEVGRTLRGVRDLIVERYPKTRQVR